MDFPLLKLPNAYRAFYGAFPALFPMQRKAIDPILEGRDLILQSATGSGKTEAVLAPCLERVFLQKNDHRILYIVPTRALAFDLKRRLDPIITPCLGLGFGVRTGDIKRSGGRNPHLLITTPESLDVLLGSRNPELREFVSQTGTIIIDEVHPLVYQYRGQHLSLLLERLERRTGKDLQKIALSATIADMDAIARFFRFKPDAVRMAENVYKEIVPHVVHLKEEEGELIALFDDLYDSFSYRKILVFANSRSACDRLFAVLERQGRFQGACGLHYSNLTARARLSVERRFRRNLHALCIATSTLELGIDVGDVDAVVLYEPPESVSAFLQRIGRANRRQDKTLFWGICRGPRAGDQVVRFLALLSLARQGLVETPLPRKMDSVLGQQTVSCIYEKGQVSLAAMKDLFPKKEQVLKDIFITMEKRGWLKKAQVKSLFQGGWRYRNCLFEYGIWSNFPETEEDYALEVSRKILAHIPRGVVAQLEPGDRVNLAGKRLQIVEIIHAKGAGRVLALPSTDQESKEILWLGPGLQVSWEVAQSVRDLLNTADVLPEKGQDGLFSRTHALLQQEREKVGHAALLRNGIQVIVTPGGFYRYLTYLGSVGNLILRWTIKHYLEVTKEEDIQVDSDAVGVDCSHWVSFTKLPLPVTRKDLALWASRNLSMLLAAFPLNSFCNTLPKERLIQEMADALFDVRVGNAFIRYRRESSEIVSGNLDFPENGARPKEEERPAVTDMPAHGEPLLQAEKDRMFPIPAFHVDCDGHSERPLTGSILAGYFRHRQCERFVRFQFLPPHLQPVAPRPGEENNKSDRSAEGVAFEETAIKYLEQTGTPMIDIQDTDPDGNDRSSKHRCRETITELEKLFPLVKERVATSVYLRGGVLFDPALFLNVGGMGIPDLIRASGEKGKMILQVCEIKASLSPQPHHKWQTALYAFLLARTISNGGLTGPVSVSKTGFLLLPALKNGKAPVVEHPFDLAPYLTAFPALLENLKNILSAGARNAGFHLKSHCTHCPWFGCCYGEALQQKDIQFLPHLTRGELDLFNRENINTIAQAEQRLNTQGEKKPATDSRRKETLKARVRAVSGNRILYRKKTTRLFPANISSAIIVLAGKDLSPFQPATLGLLAVDENSRAIISRVWEMKMDGENESSTWDDFERTFLPLWRQAVGNGKGPHIFSFGNRAKLLLRQWASGMGAVNTCELFKEISANHWTDLQQVLKTHVALPVPGETTLFSLGHVLGLGPSLKNPESLFHHDNPANALEDELLCCEEVRKWVMAHVSSHRRQETWITEAGEEDKFRPYVRFVEEEQRLRQEDVFSLQELSLKERVERFRAMGPLRFAGKELDHEGKFRYILSMDNDHGPSKLREGDFLKLVPRGVRDLQTGFDVILHRCDRRAQTVSVSSRQGSLAVNRRFAYSLEEDAADWNTPKLLHALQTAMGKEGRSLLKDLHGNPCCRREENALRWIRQWLARNGAATGLNKRQKQAMEVPFAFSTGLVDGPPGTGKTHLLGWILIALVLHAQGSGRPVRIAVSALTHQAIDNALGKVARLLNQFPMKDFPARLIKWGVPEETSNDDGFFKVETSDDPETIFNAGDLILGATGYGLYRLFDSRNGQFPRYFDWIVLDEASQILVPQAALALGYGKGKALFLGDVKQLPPIILGRRSDDSADHSQSEEGVIQVEKSILELLSGNCSPEQRVRLDITYRMNQELCRFPSEIWYDGALQSAPEIARSRLTLQGELGHDTIDRLIDPERPVTLGIVDHEGRFQECAPEAEIISLIVCRMITCFSIHPDQIAILSPHRAQNNAISARLSDLLGADRDAIPLIDTVERVQGAERDVIIFGCTTSDRDHILSEFLNNPNRFNVAITRARKKLIVIGSRIFFSSIPNTEKGIGDNACFKKFYAHCKEQKSLFFL